MRLDISQKSKKNLLFLKKNKQKDFSASAGGWPPGALDLAWRAYIPAQGRVLLRPPF
jgi:hypothetical protein